VRVASDYPAPYPLTTARAPRREGRWTEKMRRPDVCNRSPTRAPIELSDSLLTPVIRAACAVRHEAASAACRSNRAERRLTATLRLRADGLRSSPRPPGGEAMVTIGRCSVLAGAAINSPSGSAPRRQLDSATGRGCDPTSDALCRDRDPRSVLAHGSSTPAKAKAPANATHGPGPDGVGRDRQIRFHRRRVNGCDFHRPGRLSSTSAPLEGSPPPYPRLRRRGPASGAPSPLLTERLDPLVLLLHPRVGEGQSGQRRSPTSAILSTREHNRSIA
jgi:hypothetical protein